MSYGPRMKNLKKAFNKKNEPKNKTIKAIVKKEIKNAEKPKTVSATGAMRPKIMNTFVKPTRMTKMSFEGSWNALCNTTNTSVPYVFRMNSIADPDFSNFTKNTRANGWTVANSVYQAYRVHRCKITISYFNNAEAPAYVILSANNDIGIQPPTTMPSDILARPGSFGKICGRYASDNDTVSITKTYNLFEVEGISQDEYNDSATTAKIMTGSPDDNCYCYATLCAMPEGQLTSSVFGVFNIKMVFDVELLDPREPAATQP